MSQSEKIVCRRLWKIYGARPQEFLAAHGGAPTPEQLVAGGCIGALQDVSFEVRTGEILVIMGLSGSGKSTLIRCLTRLVEPTAGAIIFDGRDLMQATDAEMIDLRRHKTGMVFQHFGLLPHRTVLANVAFPLEVQGVSRHRREARAREMVKLVGLEGREDHFPRELSGGQQQRVGIARSLSVEPEVWFLDEPFSALDPLIRREMQDELLRLQRLLKKTIVFITHDFAEAVRLADRLGIMKDGRLIQLCTPEEMVSSPADSYVSEFTRDAPWAKLITARRAMLPADHLAFAGEGVAASVRIEEIAARVLEADAPVPVLDPQGNAIGMLTRRRIIDVLFGGGRP